MKNILKKIGAALWSKKVIVPLIIALSAALGYEMSADGAARLACILPLVGGCG